MTILNTFITVIGLAAVFAISALGVAMFGEWALSVLSGLGRHHRV